MNDQSSVRLVSCYSQIASQISSDDFVTNLPPQKGSIESLVQPPLMAERCDAYLRVHAKILVAFFEVADLTELTVSSNRQ